MMNTQLAERQEWTQADTVAVLGTSMVPVMNDAGMIIVHAEGDSMEPHIRTGDVLVVDPTQTEPTRAAVYLLGYGEHGYKFNRIERDPRDGTLTVRCDNKYYTDFEGVPRENVNIVGRVVGTYRKE